jgi:hypothetical protein
MKRMKLKQRMRLNMRRYDQEKRTTSYSIIKTASASIACWCGPEKYSAHVQVVVEVLHSHLVLAISASCRPSTLFLSMMRWWICVCKVVPTRFIGV